MCVSFFYFKNVSLPWFFCIYLASYSIFVTGRNFNEDGIYNFNNDNHYFTVKSHNRGLICASQRLPNANLSNVNH